MPPRIILVADKRLAAPTAAETRVGRWVNAGAGPTRLRLSCARSPDRLSANHLSRICIRTRLGSPVPLPRVFEPRVESAVPLRARGRESDPQAPAPGWLQIARWCFRHEWRWILRRLAARP